MLKKLEARHRLGTALALGAWMLAVEAAPSPAAGIRQGDLAPRFTVQTLDGETLSSDALRGKVVLLDFWATWCSPCVQAIPALEEIRKKNAGKPFVLIGVSADHERRTLEQFLKKRGIPGPQVWNGLRGDLNRMFQVSTFPTHIVLDAEGRIVYRKMGWGGSSSGRALDAAVERALAKAPKNRAVGEPAR
ncbi:MAG TPA: TlpA disulfide reductase family protein [Thermoanaerobaculia bacterium]|nr:TlpA disulfide reductase family protein [Thermoanaerobaculia bacterium]